MVGSQVSVRARRRRLRYEERSRRELTMKGLVQPDSKSPRRHLAMMPTELSEILADPDASEDSTLLCCHKRVICIRNLPANLEIEVG